MIDYEEKRSETRHRMGFMTPLLVFVLAFVACCGVIACVFLRAAVISDEAARESAGIALCRSAAEAFRAGEIPENGEIAYFTKDMASCAGSGRLLLYRNRSDRRRDRNGSVVCRENHGVYGGAG